MKGKSTTKRHGLMSSPIDLHPSSLDQPVVCANTSLSTLCFFYYILDAMICAFLLLLLEFYIVDIVISLNKDKLYGLKRVKSVAKK